MKRILKFLGKIALGFIGIILFYGISAWFLGQQRIEAEPMSEPSVEIYLLSNGVHTDIVMPLNHSAFNWLDIAQDFQRNAQSSIVIKGAHYQGKRCFL